MTEHGEAERTATVEEGVPAGRREVLAFIALQDLPMPTFVNFHSGGRGVGLTFESIAALSYWFTLFTGQEFGDYRSRFTEEASGRPMVAASAGADWRGCHFFMNAAEYADAVFPVSLDEDTAVKLREIAGGGQ